MPIKIGLSQLSAVFLAPAGIAVGIFPGDTGNLHGIATLVWFISGPISAIVAYKLETKPFAYFSVVIGAYALLDLLLNVTMHGSSPFSVFGRGGTERMGSIPPIDLGDWVWRLSYGLCFTHERQNKDLNHAVQCTEILYLFYQMTRSYSIFSESLEGPSTWKYLRKIGGIAPTDHCRIDSYSDDCILSVAATPTTVIGWFSLFQQEPLIGLIDMDLLLIVDYVLMLIVILSLWVTLRRTSESFMAIALILQIVSLATYFSSTVAFEMLSLSNQYRAAATDGQRFVSLAAGQAMLAAWQGTAFDVSYILGAFTLLIVSYVMLRSRLFSRTTAFVGILTSALMFIPPSAGMAGLILSVLSVPPTAIWLFLVGRRLLSSVK